jgi:cellulose synthase subunit
MNKNRLPQAVICFSFLATLMAPQKLVRAAEINSVDIPLESFNDNRPIELLGLISSQTLNIPIPQSWLLDTENWLEINITASPLLDFQRSSLTITLNGLHLDSVQLAKNGSLRQRILIPSAMLSLGNNALVFTGTLYLPEDRDTNCQNWDDPSRWLAIASGGVLHLSFIRRSTSVDLANFPRAFIEPLEKYLQSTEKTQTLFVLPDNSSQDDLTSLAVTSYILGKDVDASYDWNPDIITVSQFNGAMAANRNIIFINHVPAELRAIPASDKDYIAMFPSPWGLGKASMVIGDHDSQDGFSPALVFSSPARSVLLQGNVAYIEQQAPLAPQPFPNDFSLEDLGYFDRTVRGIGQQNLIYNLYLPYDTDPALVKLNLELVHSPDLDVQNSSFTIYLNGFSVAGILPTARSSTGAPITLGLPAGRFRPGINFIRIGFDLHVPYSSCERAPESVWATVLNSTTLEVTYRNRSPIPSLKHFPLPFSDYPGFVYVIPDQYAPHDLGFISRLSFMIGTSSALVNYPPQIMTAGGFMSEAAEHRNVVLVGLPSQNMATLSTNDLLPQPFTPDGKSLQDGYGVYLPTSDKDASLGLMQIIRSPWVQDGTVLVLTGNDAQGLEWAWDVILNPALRSQFTGNLMVVGSANRSNASAEVTDPESPQTLFQQIADAGNIPFIGPIIQRGGQAFTTAALIAVGTALLLVIGILGGVRIFKARFQQETFEKISERKEDD